MRRSPLIFQLLSRVSFCRARPSSTFPSALVIGLLVLVTLGLLGCQGSEEKATPEASGRPDVVLITIDTFRPDHLGWNGYSRSTAPFLESLMDRSTVFRQQAKDAMPIENDDG